jgi:heat shock protein HslJ
MRNLLWIAAVFALVTAVAACGDDDDDDDGGGSTGGLEDTRWVLSSLVDATGETVDALAEPEVTAQFDGEAHSLSGSGGCNQYVAGYTADGSDLTIDDAASTLMACEPAEITEQETAFLAALPRAASFEIDDEQLRISDETGETILTFRATEPLALIGTEWTAQNVNIGGDASGPLIEETTVTALFDEEGRLSGSAGCNNYTAGYALDGPSLTIDPPASTKIFCDSPAGIMEQEAAFLLMLPETATYRIVDNVLELRTADGLLVASFTGE